MNKFLILLCGCLFFNAPAAHALGIDPVNYTGNSLGQAADTPPIPNEFTKIGLGGPIGNDYIMEQAFEFTVSQTEYVNYLSVDASARPNEDVYRIGAHGTYNPSQNIEVKFSIVEGSKPYALDPKEFFPAGPELASTSYDFTTDDSLNSKAYSGLLLSFSPTTTELDPGNTYWIIASDPQYSGVTLQYSTELIDPPPAGMVAPEPATLALFGLGLFLLLTSPKMLKNQF